MDKRLLPPKRTKPVQPLRIGLFSLFSLIGLFGLSGLFGLTPHLASASQAMAAQAHAMPAPPPLAACKDASLQTRLEQSLCSLGLDDEAERGQLCLALVDITDEQNPRMALVNGDKMMYAASLPKIAILLGAFEEIQSGKLVMDGELQRAMTNMIRRSSNRDATYVLNRVGKKELINILKSDRYKLYDEKNHGGLWVGKEYGKSPAFQRDPLANLSHGATAFQVARFYYMLETGRLVSPNSCRLMKGMLSHSAINHKFVAGLRATAPAAKIYRKSGTWSRYHADSALVEHDGRKFIAVGLANSSKGGQWLKQVIVAMDKLVCDPTGSPQAARQ